MPLLTQDTHNRHIYWWKPEQGFSWEVYHQALGEIESLDVSVTEPLSIIADPNGDLPRGNALPHLQRLFSILKVARNIEYFVIILDKQKPVSKILMSVFLNVYFSADDFIMVSAVEEALQFLRENTNYAIDEV